jgi:uncharacterized RDD family membrane protein YckC
MEMNPYQPPIAESPRTDGPQLLASRGSRLGAALLDALAVILVNGTILWQTGLFEKMMRRPDLGVTLTVSAIGFGVWLAIQIAFLRSGQTLGKRLVGIRMVDHQTGEPASLGQLVVMRYLPVQLVGLVPVVGSFLPIIDVLFIFGADQRCIHDHIAGTKVVQA